MFEKRDSVAPSLVDTAIEMKRAEAVEAASKPVEAASKPSFLRGVLPDVLARFTSRSKKTKPAKPGQALTADQAAALVQREADERARHLPELLEAFESVRDEDEVEVRDVVMPAIFAHASGFTTTRTKYGPGMPLAPARVWREALAACPTKPAMEPVDDDSLERSEQSMRAELAELAMHLRGSHASDVQRCVVQFLLRVVRERWRRDQADAEEVVQTAWTHNPHRGGTLEAHAYAAAVRPIRPSLLSSLAHEVFASAWIYQGEGIADVEAHHLARQDEHAAVQQAAAERETAAAKLVEIVPVEENLLVVRLASGELYPATFAWPFHVPHGIVSKSGPLTEPLVDMDRPIGVRADELELARRRVARSCDIEAIVKRMAEQPGARAAIPQAEWISGLLERQAAVGAFRKAIDRTMPALQLDDKASAGWFIAALVQAGARGLRLAPKIVAAELVLASKRAGAMGRVTMSDAERMRDHAEGAMRGGGNGAWCPAGTLLEQKGGGD